MTEHPFSTIEVAGRDEQLALARRLLAEQLGYVVDASPFYREKLGGGGPPPPEALAELPLTTKDELRVAQAADPPFGGTRAAPQREIVRLHGTSGTTGRPLGIGFTAADHDLSTLVGARAYWATGVRPTDTVLHCLNYALYVGGVADHLSIERTGAMVVPIGIGQSQRILDLWQDLRPTAMFCTPSYARYLADAARTRGLDPGDLRLRLVIVGGEPGGDVPEIRATIEETWHADVGDTYGLGEVWPTFAGQCEARDGMHLTAPDALWCELIDPIGGEPAPMEPGAEGELVYTHLQRRATPLVRYRSGDIVRILDDSCGCGRRTPRFRILGRADSMFIVRGVNVYPSAIEAVLLEAMPGAGAFAILVDGPAPSPPVPILIEDSGGETELAERIADRIRARLQFSAAVRLVPPGTLGIETEHKAKRVFRTYLGERPPGLVPAEGARDGDPGVPRG